MPSPDSGDAFPTTAEPVRTEHEQFVPGLELLGAAILPAEVCVPSPAGSGHAPDDDDLAELLAQTVSVAVVGMSPNPMRTSYSVAAWLLDNTHFKLYFVNPVAAGQQALGHPFYASLAELPVVPDMVDIFRRPEHVPPVVDDAITVGATSVWMQLGITHEGAAAAAVNAGLTVIQNRCIKLEYRRLATKIEFDRATT